MFKRFAYLVKRDGMSFDDFVEYYEHRHVPLTLSLAPRPDVYKRHYVVRERPVNVDGAHGEFDVMTELGWESEADYQRWAEAVAASARTIAEDEARFLTRARTRSVVTREFPVGG